MRGKHASKPPEDILVEAKRLADNGVRELIIVAQDTTYYGIDMFGEPRLRQLLEELDQVEGLDWIRLMYFYPMYIDKALMSTIGQSKRILPYIDMPLQHINNTMLKRMSRRVTQESTVEMVSMMRETIPELVLRTTMITGFPGETDEQFEDLVEFVDRMHFERLGVFTYSIEPDTPAARLDEHLPERIKKERRNQLMAVQQKNAFEWCAKQLGKKLPILIDKAVEVTAAPQKGKRGAPSMQQAWIGRSYADAPDVDACVYVSATEDVSVKPGDLVECEIVSSDNYDLIGAALRVIP
jgi:ribosomal protein S12 methylthiotransferase